MKELFSGQHRNAELAERHRRALEREHGVEVVIAYRQNAHGQFSSRGQFFTFETVPPEDKDFDELTLQEFEKYMNAYDGEFEDYDVETSGDYGDEE